jgi:hypothetical protein
MIRVRVKPPADTAGESGRVPQISGSDDRVQYRLLENKQGLAGSPPGAPPASTEIYGTP